MQTGTAAPEAWKVWHIHISGEIEKNGFSKPVAKNPHVDSLGKDFEAPRKYKCRY